jgi:hypothetical protein
VIVVSNTSPLRALISVGQIELLKQLFGKIFIPNAVKEELLRIKKLNTDIQSHLKNEWIEIKQINDQNKLEELKNHLDSGESEAILLAKELNCNLLLMDENKGRKIAKTLDLEVLGLVGILILAKDKGYLAEIKPLIDRLREEFGFWISDSFYLKILRTIKED